MNDISPQYAWIQRVLGFDIGALGRGEGEGQAFADTDDSDAQESPGAQVKVRRNDVDGIRETIRQRLETAKTNLEEFRIASEKYRKEQEESEKQEEQPSSEKKPPNPMQKYERNKRVLDGWLNRYEEMVAVKTEDLERDHDVGGMRRQFDTAVVLLKDINKQSTSLKIAIPDVTYRTRLTREQRLKVDEGLGKVAKEVEKTGTREPNDKLSKQLRAALDKMALSAKSYESYCKPDGLDVVTRHHEALSDEATEAAGVVDDVEKHDMLNRLLETAKAIQDEVTPTAKPRTEIFTRHHVLRLLLTQVEGDMSDLEQALAKIEDDTKTACAEAETLPTLRDIWNDLNEESKKLEKQIRADKKLPAVDAPDTIGDLQKERAKDLESLDEEKLNEAVKEALKDPNTPENQAVLRAVIVKKFNIALTVPPGMIVKRLPALLELLERVPIGHLVGKKKEKGEGFDPLPIEYETTGGSPCYQQSKIKLIGIGDGDSLVMYDAEQKNEQNKGASKEGPQPAKDSPTRFTAATLHEIGHSVDEKFKIMSGGKTGTSLGGWQKADWLGVDAIVDLLYDKQFLKLDLGSPKPPASDVKALIRTLLTDGSCDKPSSSRAPLGSLIPAWETIASSPAWKLCETIRNPGQKPWNTVNDIGDGVGCHEGYSGRWYTYDAGERNSHSVRNYQWRAQGEWFADLYAWYFIEPVKEKRKARARQVPKAVSDYLKD